MTRERFGLTFYGSPPSVMVTIGPEGLPDSRRDVAYIDPADPANSLGKGLAKVIDEHDRQMDAALAEYSRTPEDCRIVAKIAGAFGWAIGLVMGFILAFQVHP